MKKIIPVLGLLAGAAAIAVYKMKKEEQKQIIDLDQGLLDDEDETIDEEPISKPCDCCEEVKENLQEAAKNLEERTEELLSDAKDTAEEVVTSVQTHAEDVKEVIEDKMEDIKETFEANDDQYPHLKGSQVEAIKANADAFIEELEKEGDVHHRERPVHHSVSFHNIEDFEEFKKDTINKGYVVTFGDEELQLKILHISAINKEKLYEHMFRLADAAAKYNGTYQGWVCKVVY